MTTDQRSVLATLVSLAIYQSIRSSGGYIHRSGWSAPEIADAQGARVESVRAVLGSLSNGYIQRVGSTRPCRYAPTFHAIRAVLA